MPNRAAWAEIDLGALAHNYREIRSRIQKGAKLCAVVKADAYGHGAIAAARVALDEGADYIAVATLSEALKLRAAGFTCPLLIAALPNVELEGVFSHFALADIPDKTFTKQQVKLFKEACDAIEAAGVHIPIKHIAESAAILEIPDVHIDMVRAGIIQYGLWPSDEVTRPIDLRPCMKFCARIVYIKTIQPGESVGYGRKFIAERETRIATLPVGYADGYIRAYAGGSVEVCGKRAPIAGRVCMDQFMIDVTDIPEAKMGDVCTLFGSETLTTDEVAGWANTINYEVVCLVSERVPRVYKG